MLEKGRMGFEFFADVFFFIGAEGDKNKRARQGAGIQRKDAKAQRT
jgi:hypothetical protein